MASNVVLLAKFALCHKAKSERNGTEPKCQMLFIRTTNAKNVRVKSFDICRCCNFPMPAATGQCVSGPQLWVVGWGFGFMVSICASVVVHSKANLAQLSFFIFIFARAWNCNSTSCTTCNESSATAPTSPHTAATLQTGGLAGV